MPAIKYINLNHLTRNRFEVVRLVKMKPFLYQNDFNIEPAILRIDPYPLKPRFFLVFSAYFAGDVIP